MEPTVIFIDRDGTLIEDTHYPKDADKVQFINGAIEGLKILNRLGIGIYVVSNQSGVGRGIISEKQFAEVSDRFLALLNKEGIQIQQIFYCKHAPEVNCECRKPRTGMVPSDLKWQKAWMVGDTLADVEFGKNLGVDTFLVRTGKGAATEKKMGNFPCSVEDNFLAVVKKIGAQR